MGRRGASAAYLLSLLTVAFCDPYEFSDCFPPANGDTETTFSFSTTKLLEKDPTEFTAYQGKVMLIINVASFCGYTPQYRYMNKLQEKYGNRTGQCNLQLFGFPCNQFGYQEPAENHELLNCIKYVRPGFGYEPLFPLAKKGDVNGMYEHPIYTFLKTRCPAPMGLIANRTDITWQPIRNNDISWNFQKWLIKHDGQPFKRYTSRTTPQAIEDDVVKLLDDCTAATKQSQQNQDNAVLQAAQLQSPQANAVPQQQSPQANSYPQKPQANDVPQRPVTAGAQPQAQTVAFEHSPQQPSSDSVALETQPKPNAFVQPPAPANQTQQQPAASGRKKRSLLPRRH